LIFQCIIPLLRRSTFQISALLVSCPGSSTNKLITPSRHTGPSIALRINSSRYPDDD
jgi:hypothetical protein